MEPNEPGSDLRNALDAITSRIIRAALEIHEKYGPVMLERAYQDCMRIEFEFRDIVFEDRVTQSIDHLTAGIRRFNM